MIFKDERKKIQCRHWLRPKSRNYSYIDEYRLNYYNDIIDFLNRRDNGFSREIPRPQTWAERALRSYTCKQFPSNYEYLGRSTDWQGTLKVPQPFRSYHSSGYYNRKYRHLLL